MEIELFGFEFGKKKTQEKSQEEVLHKFSVPETYDGTVTVEAGGFFSSAIDFTGTLKDESSSVIQYRNMAVYPEIDNAVEEIINAALVKGTDGRPVKIDLRDVPVSDSIKTKIYKEFDKLTHLLDFQNRGYEIFRRWYIDSKLFYN
ncbi:MAG: portal protein, partial [bacterium]